MSSVRSMSVEDTESFFMFVAYLIAALILLLMGYLGWRKLRRRHHHRRHIRARSRQHRGTWGSR
jgi:ABC-type nickel/cobalt efflux system permease component RcnA